MRLLLGLLWLLHWLPLPLLGRLGEAIGALLFVLVRSRRHIALTNLRLCLPELSEAERRAVARQRFQGYRARRPRARHPVVGAPARLQRLIQIEPAAPLELIGAGPLIFLCPHFVCLDVAASALAQIGPGCSIYTRQKSRVFDRALLAGARASIRYGVPRPGHQADLARDARQSAVHDAAGHRIRQQGCRIRPFLRGAGGDPDRTGAHCRPDRRHRGAGSSHLPTGLSRLEESRLSTLAGLSGQRRAGRDAPHERLHRGARARDSGPVLLDAQALQDASAGHGRCLPSAKTPCSGSHRKRAARGL